MDRSRLEISPGVWLDYRRSIFLEEHGLLAVADLHLGYAWAQRYHGQLMPFGGGDQLLERLHELCASYRPRLIVLLGDIVHQAVPVAELAADFQRLVQTLNGLCETKLILGNHDRALRSLKSSEELTFHSSLCVGRFCLIHGHAPPSEPRPTVIMGHEHPAISLGDGILGAKFPCFLVSEKVLVLPAFSSWAAGSPVGAHPFLSSIARQAKFKTAVAICGEKLLPVKIERERPAK